MNGDFERVSANDRCPICGHDSWCWRSTDGLARGCMRSDGEPFEQIMPTRETDQAGVEFWLYLASRGTEVAEPTVGTMRSAIGAAGRYKVYRQLIKRLQADRGPIRSWLASRKLPDDVISILLDEGLCILDRGKVGVCKQLVDIGLEESMAGTPGFYIDDKYGRQVWNIAGRGVLVPCRDIERRIIAAQIRRLDDDKPKYYWLSSAKQGGASPGSPIHVPRFDGDRSIVRVTEGLLKAEIATRLSGIITLGIAGTGWRGLNEIVPRLQPAELWIAYDADFRTNSHILDAIRGIARAARNWSCKVFVETWDPEYKGIDDCLVARQRTSITAVDEFVADQKSSERRTTITMLDAVLKHVSRLSDRLDVISTGLTELDEHIGGGLEFGELMIFGARPNHGKSAVGQQLLYAFAQQQLPGLFISLEMSGDRIGKRAVQHITSANIERWREKQADIVQKASTFFVDERAPIYIDDVSRDLATIQKQIGEYVERYGIKCLLIDYAQLIDVPGKRTEYEKVSEASKRIAHLTSELGIVTVLLAQVGRTFEQRGKSKNDKSETVIPTMGELKGSGQLEQDASVIVFGVHPQKYDTAQPAKLYLMQCAKVRNRESDMRPFLLDFNPARMMFSDKLPDRFDEFDAFGAFDNEEEAF